MNVFLEYKKTTAFLAGAISVFSFAPHYFVICGIGAYSLLLWLLLNAKSRKELFGEAYSFGFAHFALGFSWIGNALLIEPEKFGFLYPIVIIASGAFFGLFFALPATLIPLGRKPWQKWLFFCAAVVVFEWIRSFIFTGFPWNLTGYSLAFSDEIIQVAACGGSYLLSLVALLIYSIGGLVYYYKQKKIALICGAIVLISVVIVWVGGYWRLKNKDVKETDVVVRIVQPSIPQNIKWDRGTAEQIFQTYLEFSSIETNIKPNLIVWGETASPFVLDEDNTHLQQAVSIIPDGSYLVSGMITYQRSGSWYQPYNSMVVIDSKGEFLDYYHKSHLVPFGEYIPLREYLPDFIKPVANAIGTFGRGKGPKKIVLDNMPSFGGIICYEAIFPHEIVDENIRPDFLINLTNDGWYGNSAGPYQHWIATKMRAVEEGIAIIRAANNGISGMINAYGQDIKKLPLNYKGILDIKLDTPLNKRTIYSQFGNRVILTFCLILVFLSVIKIKDD